MAIPYKNLTFQVVVGILLGIIVGVWVPSVAVYVKLFSDIFIRLITLVIGPIVFCTIVIGISNHTDIKEAGRIGVLALIYFEVVTTFALVIGWLSAKLLHPGVGISTEHVDVSQVSSYVEAAQQLSLYEHVLHIFPNSFIDALARNDLLQILFFSLLFGVAMASLGQRVQPLQQLIDQFSKVMFNVLHMIVRLAPFAAFGAMSYSVSTFGVGALVNFAELLVSVYLTMLVFIGVVLAGICYLSGFSLWSLLKCIKDEILITLSTSSSEAVLPQLIEKLQQFGCRKEAVGLVIPMGYSFNLDGTSIYLSAAAIFIAQAYGIELSFIQEITLLAVLMLTSKGSAAVAGGGFITLAATLSACQFLPVEGIVLVIGVDRFLSEARAVTNVIGNSVAAVVISKWEQRWGQKKLTRFE